MLSDKELVKAFKAIANEKRFLILKHLFSTKELNVGELSELIKLSFKSTSRHLVVLANVELVDVRQVNLNRFYSINSENLKYFNHFFKKSFK